MNTPHEGLGNYANTVLCVYDELCVQDKNLEWTPAERKSVLLIPVSWETLVSLFCPVGPLRISFSDAANGR